MVFCRLQESKRRQPRDKHHGQGNTCAPPVEGVGNCPSFETWGCRRQTLHAKFPSQLSTRLLELPNFTAQGQISTLNADDACPTAGAFPAGDLQGSPCHRANGAARGIPPPLFPLRAALPYRVSPPSRGLSPSPHGGAVGRAGPASAGRRWGRAQLLATGSQAALRSGGPVRDGH